MTALITAALDLPDLPEAYFEAHSEAVMIPLDCLVATRRRPTGLDHAAALMDGARRGGNARRAPIDIQPIGGMRYEILDGNSTFAIAVLAGWKALPCLIRTSP